MVVEVMQSMFSQPSGKPASVLGKWRGMNWIGRVELEMRSMVDRIREALAGVVSTVTVTPCSASKRAMSIMGIMWPGASHGIRTKWRF